MSDREAIKYLEALRKLSVKLGAEEMGTKDLELIDHCINAVQEREERSKAEKTNGDHIRNMTDEELAVEFMIFRPSDKCFDVDDKNRHSIDAVEVCRCKDCKHFGEDYRYCKLVGVDAYGNSIFDYNDFCSQGERKEK